MIEQIPDRVFNLLRSGLIDQFEYDSFMLFEVQEMGKSYLRKALDAVILEEPLTKTPDNVMWIDGRRSTWREIRTAINKINMMLQGESDARSQPVYQFERPE
jgi:predicted phosphatase